MNQSYKICKIVFFLFLAVFCFSAHASPIPLKQPGTLNVLSYSEFKPISYNSGEGYEADLLKASAKILHLKIKFYPEKIYEGIWRMPSRNYTNVDIAMGGITPLLSRVQEQSAFSIPTIHFKQSLLVRKKDYLSKTITSYASFKDTSHKIGVVAGTTGEYFAQLRARENHLSINTIVQYPSERVLLAALMKGEISAIARGNIGNDYQAALNSKLITIAEKDYQEKFAFAVNKNNPELIKKLNNVISYLTDHNKIAYDDWTKNHAIFFERAVKLLELNER